MHLPEIKGQPVVTLQTPQGARAAVLLQGAQVIAWQPASGTERMYLSDKADYTPGKAFRGGVPICFPQFGANGPLPHHGFARNLQWELVSQRSGNDFALAVLALTDNEATRAVWPHAFRCEMSVLLCGERLDMELEVHNTGAEDFNFSAGLHTYLHVSEVEHTTLEGLRGLRYFDNVLKQDDLLETGPTLQVDREIDRVYHQATRPVLMREGGRALGIHADGFPDVVVWNPWVERTKQLADLPDNGFRHMLCVEAVAFDPIALAAGDSWWGRQSLVALN